MTADDRLRIGGLRIRHRVDGAGPPLLLVQGIGGSLELWDPLVRELRDVRTTIAYDHPGSGRSERPHRPVSMRYYADVARQVVERLGHERVDVLGFSFGGMVAQELAHRWPERVARLVLVGTSCGWGAVPCSPWTLACLTNPLRYYSPTYFRLVAPWLYGGTTARSRTLMDSQAATRLAHPPSVSGYYQQLLAVFSWSSLPWLRRIAARTLVVSGLDDPLAVGPNGRLLARAIPGAEILELPGAGHLLPVESAARMAPRLRAFLTA